MNHVTMIVAMVSLLGCASMPATSTVSRGGAPTAKAAPAGNLFTRMPAQIGPFKLTERDVVRAAPTDSIFRYRDGTRTILSVIVYDIPGEVKVEPDSQKWTAREGAKFKTIQDIRKSRGQISDYVLAVSDTARIIVGRLSLLEHFIGTPVRYPNGAVAVDLQHLYLIDGKFVKVRATVPAEGWRESEATSFPRELARSLAR